MYKKLTGACLVFIFITIFVNSHAYAASDNLPSGTIEQIDPGRTGEGLKPSLNLPNLLEPDVLKINIPREKAAINKSEAITFTLNGIIIEGNTAFNDQDLTKFYQDKLSTKVTFAEIQNISKSITAYYRSAGFILTRVVIPPQELDDGGIIKLQVVEGSVDQVIIQGDLPNATRKLLTAYGKNISSKKPLNIATLERFSLLANDIPGATIKTILQPSENTSGASDLVFVASQDRFGWHAGANNFNSELLGTEQMIAQINTNGMFAGSQTGLLGVKSFNLNRLKYVSLQHKQQVNCNGFGLDASISNTNTNPNFDSLSLNNLNTPGQSFIAVANGTYPIIRSRKQNLIVSAGVNYMNSHTDFAEQNLFYDAVRSINVKLAYNFLDRSASSNSIELSVAQGLNILAARAAPPSIPGGKTNFSKLNVSASRYQPLPLQNFFMLLWVKAQYAFTQLLSSEKIGFGGSPFGYGYDPSVITGDRGYELKFELQYNFLLNKYSIPRIQVFGFTDNSTVWNINKTIQLGHQCATSMGGGVRMKAIKKLHIEFIVAQPFNKFVTNNSRNRTRFLFNLMYNGGVIFI